jgi:hypothetical protein
MERTVRASCPQCNTGLRIPADWVGRTVRCKSCGAAVRTRARSEAAPSAAPQSNGVPVPHSAPAPVPIPLDLDGDPADAPVIARRGRYARGRGRGKLIWVMACLLLAAGMVFGGISLVKHLADKSGKTERVEGDGKTEGKTGSDGGTAVAQKAGPFPRRLLFISITKYMYLNPLTATKDGVDQSKPAAQRIAFDWHIPGDKDNNQTFVLSDTAADAAILMRNVVMGAYERFFESSREQDRITIYFGGHVLEKDGKAYLASVEGEVEGGGWQQTLIPLDEFYGKLKDCKAGQKVMIWDVCRFNPQRGKQRPGSDPMSPALHKALAAAPAGVEVIISCSPGENALEFSKFQPDPTNRTTYGGSVFLEAVRYVGEKRRAAKPPAPSEPLPVAEWSQAVARRVAEIAALSKDGTKQTVASAGKPREEPVAYNADEPPAKRFAMPTPPKGTSAAEIKGIEREFFVPPIRSDLTDTGLSDLPYLDSVMKDYRADVSLDAIVKEREKYPLRAATLAAFDAVREVWTGKPGTEGIGNLKAIPAPVTETLKKQILRDLEAYAVGIAKLELVDDELQKVAEHRAAESKRWQAHYDYARAMVKARLAYLNEYNKLMGDVRTETLPALDKSIGQDSYKLASSEKMKSKKEIQKFAEEAQEIFAKIIAEHPGTPWALQSKRERVFSLGLVWQPFVSGSASSSP